MEQEEGEEYRKEEVAVGESVRAKAQGAHEQKQIDEHCTLWRRLLLQVIMYAPDWILTLALAGFLAFINDVHGFRR